MIRNIEIQTTIKLITEECCNCGVMFAMPQELKNELVNTKRTFYCPNGHSQHYSRSEIDRLKENLARYERELAQKSVEKIQLEDALEKSIRKLKRVHNGSCPCCNRSFKNLQRHIATKHPELLKK